MEIAGSPAELVPVLGTVEAPDRPEWRGRFERRPSQGDHVLFRQIHPGPFTEGDELGILFRIFVFQWSIDFRDDRSMPGRADGDLDRIAADHTDGFGAGFEIHPLAIDFILVRVFRIDALDIKIHDVGADIGETPGNPVIVADDHTGYPGKGKAGHGIRTLGAFGHTEQSILVPDRRHLDAQVRVVRQKRHPGRGTGTGDRPGVGTDPIAGGAESLVQKSEFVGERFKVDG